MAPKRPTPRQTISRNVKALLKAHNLKAPEVAAKAGVDAKTMNNIVNGRFDPRPEKFDQVARVFGLSGWQLMIPDLDAEAIRNGRLGKIIESFHKADDAGRESILKVAEIAAKYSSQGTDDL